jgi:CHAT domain-containing protein
MGRIALQCAFLLAVVSAGGYAQEKNPLASEAEAAVSAGKELAAKGDIDGATRNFAKAIGMARGKTDTDQIVLACLGSAKSLFDSGNAKAGEPLVDWAVGQYEAMDDPQRLLIGINIGVKMGEFYKQPSMRVRFLRRRAKFYEKQGDVQREGETLVEIFDTAENKADVPLELALRLEKIYADTENAQGLARARAVVALIKRRSGDINGAANDCEAAIKDFKQLSIADPELPRFYNQCALILRDERNYGLAKQYLEEALKNETDPAETGFDQFNLALVYANLGETQKAIEEAKISVETVRATKNRANLASVLIGVTAIYANAGELEPALQAVDEARQIAREDGLDDVKQTALERLAAIRSMQGRSVSAAASLNRAGEIAKNGNDEGLKAAPAWRIRGMALLQNGEPRAALVIFRQAALRAEAQRDLNELAEVRNGMAQAYGHMGEYAEAETPLLQNVQFYEQRGNARESAATLTLPASLYTLMGRYYDALDQYGKLEKALAAGGGNESLTERLSAKLAAAEIYLHLQNYRKGLAMAEEVIARSTPAGLKEDAVRAERLAGRICLARGDFEQARMHFVNAETFDYRGFAYNEGLVEVYLQTGNSKAALDELGKVKQEHFEQTSANPELEWRFYTQRGLARLSSADFQGGQTDLHHAIDLIEYARLSVMGRHSAGYLDAGDFGSRARPYQGLMEMFASFWLMGVKDQPARLTGGKSVKLNLAALHYSEMLRGRTQFDGAKTARQEQLYARLPKALRDKQDHILAETKNVASQLDALEQRGEEPSAQLRATEKRLQAEAVEFREAIRKEAPEYDLIPGLPFVESLPLGHDEVILEYAIGLRSAYLFIVRKQGIELVSLPISIEDLESKVQVFRDLTVKKRFSKAMAADLYWVLLGRAQEYLKPNDKLVIIPDGFLASLPFEALIVTSEKKPPVFFGANREIAYAESISSMALARMVPRPVGSKPLFAVADPIFDGRDERYSQPVLKDGRGAPDLAGSGYSRLPDTRDEAEAVAKLVGVKAELPDVLIGAAAVKEAFLKTELGGYRYIHLATHAAAFGELGRVNEPFFVLGASESGRFEGQIIRMSELAKLKLSAELVVLAACDTGRGDVLQGDGVANLASAFLYAGAHNVLLSLWKAPSKATVLFMQKFYGYLQDGKSESEALQLAKEAMRAEYPEPYYWALFVLYEGGEAERRARVN